MIRVIFSFVLFFSLLLSGWGCKDNPSEPGMNNPGYQEDIQWVSIADAPWPKHRFDAQNTGRSPYSGPQGIINWTIDTSFYLNSELVLDEQNHLYVVSCVGNTGLYKYNLQGLLEWGTSYGLSNKAATTPLLTSSGKVIVGDNGRIYCLKRNGEIEWSFRANSSVFITGIGLDKDGNILFTDTGGTLYSINQDGNLNWSFTDNRFYGNEETSIGFSPDGKTIYFPGWDVSLFAFDIVERKIKWSIEKGRVRSSPMIDSQGNVYFISQSGNLSSKYLTFYSVSVEGQERFSVSFTNSYSPFKIDPTIDKNGNLFFAGDTLYSLDYQGNLRWKNKLTNMNLSPLVSDKDGNIYLITGDYMLECYNNNGGLKWSFPFEKVGSAGYSPVIGSNNNIYMNVLGTGVTNHKIIYSIK